MLLTSSQVSVAISSGVVVLCTLALFLSGYVIQQRTVRQIRQSIREPKPEPPKMFLPDRFKAMTTELDDGTVITLDDDAVDGTSSLARGKETDSDSTRRAPGRSRESPAAGSREDAAVVVEVAASVPGAEDEKKHVPRKSKNAASSSSSSGSSSSMAHREDTTPQRADGERVAQQEAGQPASGKPAAVQGATDKAGKPEKPDSKQRPISKAERRRRIKEELMRLSYDSKPVYYQRRLY